MTDKNYITPSQYEKIVRKMKEYVDKSIPHKGDPEVIFTIPANTVLEINNSETKAMEFDKPSNININYDFIVNYNNEDIDSLIGENEIGKYIDGYNDNIELIIYPGKNINQDNDEGKMIVFIDYLNPDITPTDIVLKQAEAKYLNNKYLKNDVAIRNSITIGTRDAENYIGLHSFSNGRLNTASGVYSHAEGVRTNASGFCSHTEGVRTNASSDFSHAEGSNTMASGNSSHAEGYYTIAKGQNQHVQGKYNIEDTANKYAHIVGNGTSLSDRKNAHTLDWNGNAWYAGQVKGTNLPYNISSRVLATIPANTINLDTEITATNISLNNDRRYYIEFLGIKKLCSLSLDDEDENVIICSINNYKIKVYNGSANIIISISKINNDITTTDTFTDLIIYEEENKYLDSKYLEYDLILQNSISLGRVGNIGPGSSAIGYDVRASGYYSHAEGEGTKASGDDSHAEGYNTTASGGKSHAEGASTTASGWSSHAEGNHTTASGESSHAEGYTTTASGDYSHAEGNVTKASAFCSHAEGNHTTASGDDSHAEGFYTTASASGSHAEGVSTTASGEHSHAEGDCTTASGSASHAEGQFTIASGEFQHVQGKFNIEDTENKYLHIVGNGKYDDQRSNAHTLDWNGNGWYAGKLSQDGTPTADKDLTTKKYVDDTVGANKVNICADEEITNMLTEVLGVGYSATE